MPDSETGSKPLPDLLPADPAKRSLKSRILLWIGGVSLIIAGIVLWILPVVTGVPFLILGLALLAKCSRRVAIGINRLETRLPMKARLWLRTKM